MYPPDDRVLACLWPPGLDVPGCGFELYWYGVIIVAGMLIGAYLGSREAARRGIDPDHVWGGLTWALIFGIIGARLYHVLTPPPSMGITPFDYLTFRDLNANGWPDIIELRAGGLGIVGAIIGGLAGVAIYCRRNKLSFLTAADLAGYSMPIGQAIGRWANFFNQELYGAPTTLPWGLRIDMVNRVPPYNDLALYPDTTRFHPAFLYESLWNLLAFGMIVYTARRYGERLLRGELFALYAVLYAIGRILTETVRADSPTFPLGGLDVNYASAVSALAIVVVAGAVVLRRRAAAAGAFGSEEWEEDEID
jgi:phosphatidylglycerol:prolipoprotein diacylglycerol transferase